MIIKSPEISEAIGGDNYRFDNLADFYRIISYQRFPCPILAIAPILPAAKIYHYMNFFPNRQPQQNLQNL